MKRTSTFPVLHKSEPMNFLSHFVKKCPVIILVLTCVLMLITDVSRGQTSVQNFGTGTFVQTSATGSTGVIPVPTSGTTWARGGAVVPNGSVNGLNTSNPLGTTGTYVRAAAASTTSVTKFSPWVAYTGAPEFYTSFKVMFGDAAGSNTATTGSWTYYQGAGAMYNNASDFSSTEVFTGLRFTFGAAGALALTYRSGSFINTGLTQTTFSSGTVYTIEIIGNNKTTGTINYTYSGNARTVAVQKFDLYINGSLIGDDLSPSTLPVNTNIVSGTFIGISSTANAANVFVDDAIVYNAVPASIGVAPPTVITNAASAFTTTGATLNGTVSANGFSTTAKFDYGLTTSYSTTNATATTPASGTVTGNGTAASLAITGLSVNTQYNFRATASGGTGGTTNGSNATFYTLANVPSTPTVGNPTTNSLDVAIGTGDGNPAATEYAIQESTGLQYVQPDGSLGAVEAWQDAATWAGTPTVFGLASSATYTFRVKARNGANTQTAFGTGASGTTDATPDPTATLSATPALSEENLNGGTFTITLANDAFSNFTSNPTSLTAGNFTLNNAPAGTSITSVVATSATTATVTLAFSGDFDANVTNFNIDIADLELASASVLTSNSLAITSLTETITATASIAGFGSVCLSNFSAVSSFTVSGTDLRDNITVTAPAGFEISATNSPFTPAVGGVITLTPTSNVVSTTTLYARFAPTSAGATGTLNITAASTGATTKNTTVSGTGINTPPSVTTPTSTAVTATTATLGGNITSIGCASVTERGIYWSTTNGFADGAGTKESELGTFATGVFTIPVTGLPAGTTVYFKAFALNGIGTAYSVQGSFTTTKAEPTDHPTVFSCGTTTAVSIPLTWVDAAGAVAPDGYLIKWSAVDFASVTDPSDGSISNGANSTTVNQGTQAASITGLSSNTTYFFKIYSYTNSGASIDYKIGGSVQQTSCTTLLAPCFTSTGATAGWNFTAGTAAPSATAANLTVGNISSGNNNTAPASFINGTSASSGYTGASGTNNAGAAAFTGVLNTATSTYFAFTLTPAATYNFILTGISFGSRSTSTGPVAYSVRSSKDNFATDIATGTLLANSTWALKSHTGLTVAGLGNASPVTFRIYGHSGTGNAATGTANWRVDDITLTLTISNAPTTATTGGAQTICGLTSTSLGGNTPSVGTATWSQVSGPGTTTFNGGVNSGSATATASVIGTYLYRWTIDNGCATVSTADVSVEFKTPTTVVSDAAPALQTVFINTAPDNLTFSATGAPTVTYQWYSNGTNNSNIGGSPVTLGSGGTTATYTPPTNVLGITYYYAVATGATGCTATSSAAAVTITNSNVWKGGGTSDWSLGTNWISGVPPTGANDAVIPNGNTPYPALSASSAINDLSIDPGATVDINGFTFTITGVATGTGTLSGSATSSLVTNATTTIRFTPGANILKNLNVTAGTTTLGNALDITAGTALNTYGTVTVANGATLASNGNLNIKSNQFGTARVAAGATGGNYITGDVTVERYIPANSSKAWRLLSVPTKGTKTIKQTWQENQAPGANGLPGFGTQITANLATLAIIQAAGFDAFSQAGSAMSYNSGTQAWTYLTSTNSAPIETNKGYFLYIRGSRAVSPSNSTAPVDATVLRTTGTLYQGDNNTAISVAAGKFEPVGNTYASAIDFTNLSKTGTLTNSIYVWDSKLVAGNQLGAYQTFVGALGFTPATNGGSYPAGVPNTTIESGQAIMVGAPAGGGGTIKLVEAAKTTGNQLNPFRPAAQPAQFRTSLYKAGNTAVFADNNIVVFDNAYSNAADANDAVKIAHGGENLDILTDNKSLVVDARQPVTEVDIIHYSLKNLQAQSYKLSFTTLNMNTAGLTAFVEDKYLHTTTEIDLNGASEYNFTVDANNAASSATDRLSVVFKKAGTLPVSETKPAITVSPNPVEGGVANLKFSNQAKGKYTISLLGTGGNRIFTTFAQHAGGNGTQLLNLPSGLARGTYQLEVVAPDKTKQVQTLFINTNK